ncbi:unnamed protein product [Closterium sp. NIES-65]|nr:unnamed protein product [Closterium sp. NIES-65]
MQHTRSVCGDFYSGNPTYLAAMCHSACVPFCPPLPPLPPAAPLCPPLPPSAPLCPSFPPSVAFCPPLSTSVPNCPPLCPSAPLCPPLPPSGPLCPSLPPSGPLCHPLPPSVPLCSLCPPLFPSFLSVPSVPGFEPVHWSCPKLCINAVQPLLPVSLPCSSALHCTVAAEDVAFENTRALSLAADKPWITCAEQRPAAVCDAFCGLEGATTPVCNGLGVCYLDGPNRIPTCRCEDGAVQDGRIYCAPPGSVGRKELVALTILTKGAEATAGVFTADPLAVATYRTVPDGCGADLPIRVEFTFFMFPSAGGASKAGQGLAFVISATNAAGTGGEGGGVGYAGMDGRSIAVEFDTFTDAAHGDMPGHHVGLNTGGSATSIAAVRSGDKPDSPLLESPLSLCDVLQPTQTKRSFYFGFVASSVAPFQQQHAILVSFVETDTHFLSTIGYHLSFLLPPLLPTTKFPALSSSPPPQPPNPPAHPPPTLVPPPLPNLAAYGLSVSQSTFRPASASPFTRYVSAAYALSGQQDAWLLRDPSSWDVPWLSWPVKDQDACNACWAYAVVASIEAAYGIATNQAAPQLSVESLFAAMGLTSQAKKCTTGGSPTEAFEKLLALPKKGLTLATSNIAGVVPSKQAAVSVACSEAISKVKYYPVQGFERTRFKGYVGLMLAVQRQPVVVHIQASAPTFAAYDGVSGTHVTRY